MSNELSIIKNFQETKDDIERLQTSEHEPGPGGAPLTIKEIDGSPSVANVTEIQVTNGKLTDNTGGSVTLDLSGGSDPNAIHTNVAGEIAGITEKDTPISADMLVIEDSADTNNKKMVEIGDLPFTNNTGTVTQITAGDGLTSSPSPITTSGTINAGEGPGIDVTSDAVGLGGDSILLYHANGNPVSEYATVTLACAAAASGDRIELPPQSLTEDFTVPADVAVVCVDRTQATIHGQVTLSVGSVLNNLTVEHSSTNTDVNCIVGPTSGKAEVYNCNLLSTSTSGNPLCVQQMYGGSVELYYCTFLCQKNGTDIAAIGLLGSAAPDVPARYYLKTWDDFTGTTSPTFENGGDVFYDIVFGISDTWAQQDVNGYIFYGSDRTNPKYWFGDENSETLSRTGNDFGICGSMALCNPVGVTISLTSHASFSMTNIQATMYGTAPWPASIPAVGDEVKVYACEMAVLCGYPLLGDRSAIDVINHFALHSNETNMLRHMVVPTNSSGDAGKVNALNAGGTAYTLQTQSGTDSHAFHDNTTQSANKVLAGPTTGADANPAFRALVNADLPEPVAYKSTSTLTITSDAVTITKNFHTLTSESGTSDDLATINGGTSKQFIVLQATATHTITVKHGTGNIYLNGAADFALTGDKTLILFYDGTNYADVGAGGGSIPVKASAAELDTGTDDAKFATAKGLKDSHNVPSVVPGTTGNVLISDGTDWISSVPAGGGDVIQDGAVTPGNIAIFSADHHIEDGGPPGGGSVPPALKVIMNLNFT